MEVSLQLLSLLHWQLLHSLLLPVIVKLAIRGKNKSESEPQDGLHYDTIEGFGKLPLVNQSLIILFVNSTKSQPLIL